MSILNPHEKVSVSLHWNVHKDVVWIVEQYKSTERNEHFVKKDNEYLREDYAAEYSENNQIQHQFLYRWVSNWYHYIAARRALWIFQEKRAKSWQKSI